MVTARITTKGQITIPKAVRDQLDVKPGDALEFLVDEQTQRAEVRPVRRRSIAEFRGAFRVASPPEEPFDWSVQRERAWEAQTERLVPEHGTHSAAMRKAAERGT
jgi:antitoxin PrlF